MVKIWIASKSDGKLLKESKISDGFLKNNLASHFGSYVGMKVGRRPLRRALVKS